MLVGEIEHASCAQMVSVRRVSEGVCRGEVWDGDEDEGTWDTDAVNLFHRARQVLEVLEHIISMDFGEVVVRKWPRRSV